MQSGTGCSSALRDRNVREVPHGLGQRPDYVEVWVRVPESTPTYGGLMFKATGAANGNSLYMSGTLTAWSSTAIRIWMSCQFSRGIYLTGFGGERLQMQDSITKVDIKVRAWIDFPGGSGSGVSSVTINVNDANRPPVLSDLVVDVPETAESGTDLGQLQATDPDGTSQFTYGIGTGDSLGLWSLGQTSGVLQVQESQSLSTNDGLTRRFIATVSDGAQSDAATVTIRLEDANRAPVVFSAEMEVPEKSASGTLVSGSLRAVDPDRGDSVLFSIIDGNIGNTFRIAGCGGELRVGDATLLDVDLYEEFLLTILVQDDGVPALNSTAYARIRILDVNEPPICEQLTRNVSETAPIGSMVGMPLDAYEPEDQDLLWELTYGNDDGTFGIDRFTG